ncbi:MAG: ATP synthase F1 subunit delta [Candidatus Omnitrophica bacterium]|nr:ATP synthase F1 subunit delta [Candidatus Omnitrophota bacterium]
MGQRIVVKRYAEAFAEYAAQVPGLKQVVEEVKALKAVIRDNPEFCQMLSSPALTLAEKYEFIDKVFEGRFSQEISHLVKVITEKRHVDLLFDMLEYIRVNYSYGEEISAVLKSADILDLDDIRQIKERLEKKLQKKLRLYLDLDPDLLAGIQITVGTTVIDGSLKRRLEELREKVKSARMG